jgi:hypothetical protein
MREWVQLVFWLPLQFTKLPACSFARLVFQKDREIFGEQEFSAIPREAIVLPSDDKFHEEMSRAARAHPSSAKPIHELADHDLFV